MINVPILTEDGPREMDIVHLLPPAQVAVVEAMHHRFLSSFICALSEILGTPVDGNLVATQPNPGIPAEPIQEGCVASMATDPGPGRVSISMASSLLFHILDILIGAPPDATKPARSSLTDLEIHILRPVFDLLYSSFRSAWASCPVGFKDFEIQPASQVEIQPPESSATLVLRGELEFGEKKELLTICVPSLLVRQVTTGTGLQPVSARRCIREDVREAILGGKVQIEAVLVGSTIRMHDLLVIEPGQILLLNQSVDTPLECRLNGVAKFIGELGGQGERTTLLLAHNSALPKESHRQPPVPA